MPLRCPTKDARGMMMDVRMRDAKGVRYIGILPNPNTLKLATPPTAKMVIHLSKHRHDHLAYEHLAWHMSMWTSDSLFVPEWQCSRDPGHIICTLNIRWACAA